MPLKQLSPSKLNILNDCPRCFWLQENAEIKRPPSIFPSLPSGIDKVLKKTFDDARVSDAGWLQRTLGVQGELYSDMADIKRWRNWKSGLSCEIPELGIKLVGALDDCITAHDRFSPWDYKTKGYPPKTSGAEWYQAQLDCYSLMLEKNGMPPSGKGYLHYFWPEKADNLEIFTFQNKVFEIPCSPSNAIKLLEKARGVLNLKKPPDDMGECGYCKYAQEMFGAGFIG